MLLIWEQLENKTAWDEYYGGQYYSNWVYGLPELIVGQNSDGTYRYQQAALRSAKRIAGPGCNVTAVTLAIQPGIAEGFIEGDIVADLAVGYSGAGKNLKKTFLLGSEAMGSATAYSVGGTHRHIPEIMQNLAEIPLLLKETSDIGEIKTETENFIKEINKGKGVVIINAEGTQANQFLSKDNISVIIV